MTGERYLDGRPAVPRVRTAFGWWRDRWGGRWRWLGWWRWYGYLGSDQPGVSYGLCGHAHRTPWTALRCARRRVRALA